MQWPQRSTTSCAFFSALTRASMCRQRAESLLENGRKIGAALSKRSCIKMKRHRFAEFPLPEIWVSRVQQDIPFATDCRRWDQQGYRLPGVDPFISKATHGFISGFVPVVGQSLLV